MLLFSLSKRNELPLWIKKHSFGLLFGSCGGIGKTDLLTERMCNRIAPMLAIGSCIFFLYIILWAAISKNQFFSELLAFSSAIIGSVVGYYFSSKEKCASLF